MASDPWVVAQSVASIALIVVSIPGIIIAVKQLKVTADASRDSAAQVRISAEAAQTAANAAKASALGVIATAGRELQWKVLHDDVLHSILVPHALRPGLTDEQKLELVRGMLITYYSFVFEFKLLGQIPEAAWPAFMADMSDFFAQDANRERWARMKQVMSKEFQHFIDHGLMRHP